MGLDAHVVCACLRDGRAKPHPLPERLGFDETGEPYLKGNPSPADDALHDRWWTASCEHGGYQIGVRLGNITGVAKIREFLRTLEGNPGPKFPILLQKVVYDGTHCGDWIPIELTRELSSEVDIVLHSSDILNDWEKEFFGNMKKLCEASVVTGNPIVF
jgi:hypothetical protein